MQNDKLENQIEFLLSAALQKCGDIHEAEDLTQETLMAALSFMSNGHEILDLRAWLLTVLSHKWNDSLRKKYRRPAVLMGEDLKLLMTLILPMILKKIMRRSIFVKQSLF